MLCLSGFELYSRWVPLHDNSEVPSESDREDLGAFEDNLECQSGQDNRNRSSNGKANNLSCDRKW